MEILENIQDVNRHHTLNMVALIYVLIAKGVITDEEFIETRKRIVGMVDQELAKAREEAEKQWKEDDPKGYEAVQFLKGLGLLGGK